MNSINPQSLRKLLLAFGLSMLIIIIYLILKVFLQEEKTVKLKSFENNATLQKQVHEEKEVPLKKDKFLLLPSK